MANPLAHLAKQFKALMTMETSMSEEDRKNHQFQLLATVGKKTYIVVKGGANTVGYRIDVGDERGEMKYMGPLALMEILERWATTKYVKFVMLNNMKKVVKSSAEVADLLALRPKFSAKIIGVDAAGKGTPLHEWKGGVFKSEWTKAKK